MPTPNEEDTLIPPECVHVIAGIANFKEVMEKLGDGETRLFVARVLKRAENIARHFDGDIVDQGPDHVVILARNKVMATRIAEAVREKFASLWVPHDAAVQYFTRIDERMKPRRSTLSVRITYNKKIFTIDQTAPLFTIGRLPSACLSIDSDRVSRRHATLELSEGTIILNDSSTNGTYVKQDGENDATRVHNGKHPISRNATIAFGSPIEKPTSERITLEIIRGIR